MNVTRRKVLVLLAGGAIAGAVGCGGSSKSDGTTRANAPTATTRARVQNLHALIARGLGQGGATGVARNTVSNGIALCQFVQFNGPVPGGGTGGTSGGTTGGGSAVAMPTAFLSPMPRTGDFLNKVAATRPTGRKVPVGRAARITRQEGGGTPAQPPDPPQPPDWQPAPTFYFDYYLNLWVLVTDTATESRYQLYEDQGKSLPAGKIDTTYPADWTTYPQVYASTYEYTAGFLSGSHGFSKNTTNADGSGSMAYEDVYADGGKDSGQSNWSGLGDSSWTSRSDTADGQWSESSGTFRADGSGGTRTNSSDGYAALYSYNADGSGRGRITGPDPGLPVTIVWDAYGNTTITYADGTVEHYPGWGFYDGGGGSGGTTGGPIPVDTGVPPIGSTAPKS